ncbi:hypothetical protein EW145_g4813 [Phellinidium pouzarii]|uniref:Tetratricopeptide SHNi-TPR domain-containing protein n=1 Tax=Phellinidium pouzarii TaxID=167371 RepID=A0A4V3XCD3_9AGAM|nr:hypothetical protein EW145_g4813 [Phellinidium pouzarii]
MTDTKATKIPAGIAGSTEPDVEDCVEKAKRAVALRKYEQAVDHYATALEIMAAKYGDGAPEAADLYFAYGKALLENAISQSAVLGKEQAEESLLKDEDESADASGGASGDSKPFISFFGDVEDDALMRNGEETAIDLFAEANAAVEREEKGEDDEDEDGEGEDDDDEEEDEGEPEDDFNAAWEVLDLARALYEKGRNEDDEIKLKLADTLIALGDVSLETEKFDVAIPDYEKGVALKSELLPFSSRQIAEAHYKLSIVFDLTPGRLALAIEHAEKAFDSVESRLVLLRNGLNGQPPLPKAPKPDTKGKGKAKATAVLLAQNELVQNMSKSQIEAEIKELDELKEDLALKVEELKTSPSGEPANAPELAAKALDRALNAKPASASDPSKPVVVNDLTTMVKKKKKSMETNSVSDMNIKRKAEDSSLDNAKKLKLEDAATS